MTGLKKLLSIVLAMTLMLTFSVGAMAAEKDNVVTKTNVEYLGDGLTVTETTTIHTPSTRIGFGGTPSATVTHEFTYEGEYAGYVEIYAKFSSVVGENCCYLDDYSYDYDEPMPDKISFGDLDETIESDEGLVGNKYARYKLSYKRYNFIGRPQSRSMFIKCTSNAVITK